MFVLDVLVAMRRQLFRVVLLVLVLLVFVSPALAQDGTPPADSGAFSKLEIALIGLLFVAVVLIGWLTTQIKDLSKVARDTLPPWLMAMLKENANMGMGALGDLVHGTPTNIDDQLYERIRLAVERFFEDPANASAVVKADKRFNENIPY